VVIGTKIINAGTFTNPKLNGAFILKRLPDTAKPMAPIKAIKNPIAAELPMAIFIG